jgi:hypothetical protein
MYFYGLFYKQFLYVLTKEYPGTNLNTVLKVYSEGKQNKPKISFGSIDEENIIIKLKLMI